MSQTQRVSYLTTDHLGSPRIITDQSGAVVSRKDFAAYGDEVVTPQRTAGLGYQPTGIREDYTGYQRDEESGLEFAEARYYNPTHGRFTSVDPLTASATIRNPQTLNRYSYALNSPYKFTDPLGLIPGTTSACGSWCPGGDSGSFGSGGAFDSIASMIGIDIYYLVRRISQYQTAADDGNRQASITISIIVVLDRNGTVAVADNLPSVITTATNIGRNPFSSTVLATIENIVTTTVKLAIRNNFEIPILLALLKTETQYGALPNREPGNPQNKISEINPGQFSKQPNGDRAVSASEAGGEQNALKSNIGKTMDQWNSPYVQKGKTLNDKFQLYNSQEGIKEIYANKAEKAYNSIKESFKVRHKTIGSFFSLQKPNIQPLSVTPCSLFNPCPRF